MIKNVYLSLCNVPVILNETLIFLIDFIKTLECQISWKSVQSEQSCSMKTDRQTGRQTDMTKLIVAFHSSSKAPEKSRLNPQSLLIALVCLSGQATIVFLDSNCNEDILWIVWHRNWVLCVTNVTFVFPDTEVRYDVENHTATFICREGVMRTGLRLIS
jgi:hypothetical protein